MNRDQSIAGLIFILCVAVATTYAFAMFWPALEAIRIWLIGIPVLIGLIAILAIGAWIGWTMATTPPPKPIEDLQFEETQEIEAAETGKKKK